MRHQFIESEWSVVRFEGVVRSGPRGSGGFGSGRQARGTPGAGSGLSLRRESLPIDALSWAGG